MTEFPEVFEGLNAPFQEGELRERKQAGRNFQYITARTAMNRLDTVLGPENWWDEYLPGENSVICRLTIRLPDGSTLTKQDAGGYAGMADQGDDDKSGFSDAFKRAAVKFGVGRYLYKDGQPTFARVLTKETARAIARAPLALPAPEAAPPPPEEWGPNSPAELRDWLRQKKREPDPAADLTPAVLAWADLQGYPKKMGGWSPIQVRRAYAEAIRLEQAARRALDAQEVGS